MEHGSQMTSPIEQRRKAIADLALTTGLTPADLQTIANGGIMDPNRIFLPAGTCSVEEMREREAKWSNPE